MDKPIEIIKGENITKSYGDVSILKGIDLSVTKGEMISIVGKSGAGKSTILHILGTLDTPDSGTLSILGTPIQTMNEKQMASFRNQNIGFIFQFHHLLPEFTALENVCIPGYIARSNSQQIEKKAKELLDYLELGHRINHKPTQLSGGEAQRVAVARAMINDPAVIFADEPTGNLDKANSDNLHQLFVRLREDFETTLVIVTHNIDLAQLSDRIITIEDGRIKE